MQSVFLYNIAIENEFRFFFMYILWDLLLHFLLVLFILCMDAGILRPFSGNSGYKAGDTSQWGANPLESTFKHSRHLIIQQETNNHTTMSFDCLRKPKITNRTCKLFIHGPEVRFKAPTRRCDVTVLTTEPTTYCFTEINYKSFCIKGMTQTSWSCSVPHGVVDSNWSKRCGLVFSKSSLDCSAYCTPNHRFRLTRLF